MGKRLNVSQRPQKPRAPIELSGFSTEPSWDTVQVIINGSMFWAPKTSTIMPVPSNATKRAKWQTEPSECFRKILPSAPLPAVRLYQR